MSKKKHFFRDQKECEAFFTRVAMNYGDELTSDFVFEGNSGTTYQYVIDIAKIIGYENIGVGIEEYTALDLDFVDEIYIRLRGQNPDDDTDNRKSKAGMVNPSVPVELADIR